MGRHQVKGTRQQTSLTTSYYSLTIHTQRIPLKSNYKDVRVDIQKDDNNSPCKNPLGAGEMAQPEKTLTAKPEDLSLIHRTYMVEG